MTSITAKKCRRSLPVSPSPCDDLPQHHTLITSHKVPTSALCPSHSLHHQQVCLLHHCGHHQPSPLSSPSTHVHVEAPSQKPCQLCSCAASQISDVLNVCRTGCQCTLNMYRLPIYPQYVQAANIPSICTGCQHSCTGEISSTEGVPTCSHACTPPYACMKVFPPAAMHARLPMHA